MTYDGPTAQQEEAPNAGGDPTQAALDYWAISGDALVRFIMQPRTEMFFPAKENTPTPLRYIDITRVTYTILCSKSKAWISDYWPVAAPR